MDLKSSGLVCDNPLVRGKEFEEFIRKWETLSENELSQACTITRPELMNVLNQNVPCVGCRRSVERLYYQLHTMQHPFDPLLVNKEGVITIKEDRLLMPQILCSLFHDHS